MTLYVQNKKITRVLEKESNLLLTTTKPLPRVYFAVVNGIFREK